MDSIEYEALRRAQEMQRGQNQNRSQRHNQSQGENQTHNPQKREPEHSPKPAQKSAENPHTQGYSPLQSQPVQTQNSDLLGTLFEDKERLLILALILILSGEDSGDPALILALLYLII